MPARLCLASLAALALLAALPSQAQPASAPAAAAPSDDTLYRALGGQEGLVALMDDFVPRLVADPQLGHFFAKTDQAYFKDMLVQQFCAVSGGGCNYKGMKMKAAHEEHEIRMSDFTAMVALLQDSMNARGIPFSAQNRLLARLAPMHRDVVNTK